MEDGTESYSIDLAYLQSGFVHWFSKTFEVRPTGEKWQYRIDRVPIGVYSKGEKVIDFELHLVGARGLHTLCLGSIMVTGSTLLPIEVTTRPEHRFLSKFFG